MVLLDAAQNPQPLWLQVTEDEAVYLSVPVPYSSEGRAGMGKPYLR
jgi:hypothetical protein